MMYVLDTNAVVAILRGRSTMIKTHIRRVTSQNHALAISSLVLCELWYGVAKSADQEMNAKRIRTFLSGVSTILTFDDQDAQVAGRVRAELERKGTPIGPYELLIAGQGLRHKATLVTANTDEFERVPGLRLANWTR